MKVVITRRASVDIVDGVNTFVFELSSALMKMGCEVSVVTYFSKLAKEDIRWLFDVDKIPEVRSLKSTPYEGSLSDMLTWLINGSVAIFNQHPHLVIMNGVIPLLSRSKIVLVNHGTSIPRKWYHFAGAKVFYRILPNSVVCVSNKLKNEILNYLRPDSKKVKVISIGVNAKRYKPSSLRKREKAVLHVGTKANKNLITTIRAFNLVAKKVRSPKLYIAGSHTPDVDKALELVDREFRKQVCYLGIVRRQFLRELYSRIRAVVIPSLYEAFPYVVLEALASGTPVVASLSLPAEEMIDEFNGFVVQNPYNYKRFADHLFNLLTDDSLWKKLSNNALKHARHFDIIDVAKQYIGLIKNQR